MFAKILPVKARRRERDVARSSCACESVLVAFRLRELNARLFTAPKTFHRLVEPVG